MTLVLNAAGSSKPLPSGPARKIVFLIGIRPKPGPEARFQARKHSCITWGRCQRDTLDPVLGYTWVPGIPCSRIHHSAELSHCLRASDRRRNTPISGQNRSESLRAGLWVSRRIFSAWSGPALSPKPVRNRRFPAGSLKSVRGPFSSVEIGFCLF